MKLNRKLLRKIILKEMPKDIYTNHALPYEFGEEEISAPGGYEGLLGDPELAPSDHEYVSADDAWRDWADHDVKQRANRPRPRIRRTPSDLKDALQPLHKQGEKLRGYDINEMKITRTQLRKLIIEASSITADRKVNYQVAKGDSWWKITNTNSPGRTPEENAALNNMSVDDVLQPCQVIKIWSIAEYEGGAMDPNCDLNESEDDRSKALKSAMASIEDQFGAGAIIDTGAGNKLSNDWMKFVLRNQRHQDVLLSAWDQMISGSNPGEVKQRYIQALGPRIAGAITFYGRRIRPGESYLSGAEIAQQIAAEVARREEERSQPAPSRPFERPRFGRAFNPETGQWVTGYDETWH